jgi:hypothetical protein
MLLVLCCLCCSCCLCCCPCPVVLCTGGESLELLSSAPRGVAAVVVGGRSLHLLDLEEEEEEEGGEEEEEGVGDLSSIPLLLLASSISLSPSCTSFFPPPLAWCAALQLHNRIGRGTHTLNHKCWIELHCYTVQCHFCQVYLCLLLACAVLSCHS